MLGKNNCVRVAMLLRTNFIAWHIDNRGEISLVLSLICISISLLLQTLEDMFNSLPFILNTIEKRQKQTRFKMHQITKSSSDRSPCTRVAIFVWRRIFNKFEILLLNLVSSCFFSNIELMIKMELLFCPWKTMQFYQTYIYIHFKTPWLNILWSVLKLISWSLLRLI